MTSTYLLYRTYAANLPQTLSRIGAQSDVASAAAYYQANIGNVKSVDDFLNNTRLFTYAMTAYGLSDMAYAKAFMKKVLTSNLTDSSSFVNKLTDPRFLAFAKAYQFSIDGSVTKQAVVPQTQSEEDDTIGLYTQTQVNKGAAAADEATYYQSQIGNITSVDQLMSNTRLLRYVVTAYGLNPDIVSNATIKAVLTSNLSDPNSTANTLNNSAYQSLAAAFNFNADGTVNGTAQSSANMAKTVYQYFNGTGTSATPAAAAYKTQYYKAAISGITSVDDLLNDSALKDVALTAFGLNPVLESNATIKAVLTSDLSDPNSVANQQTNAAYKKLAAAFNFNADGSVNGSAQTADQTNSVIGLYSTTYDDALQASNNRATTAYKSVIASAKTVDDLLQSTAYNFILKAYGFDSSTMTKYTLKQILTSDPNDPHSFARQSHNAAYVQLATDFNFDANGKSKTATTAQTQNNIIATGALYTKHNGGVAANGATPTLQQSMAQTETQYYVTTMAGITNVDQFLKNSRLVNYALDAYGLKSANLSTSDLRKILTSDPLDPKSYINQPANAAYRKLAVAFNFGTDGQTLTIPTQQVQDRSQIVATGDGYLEQTMETQAGDQSDGVRLALYFLNKAPSITSPYQLLADKALLQFTQTALGLSSAMSQADIDTQANMITQKLNLADLQDPTKLNKLIAKFSALYDVNNSDVSSTSPVVQILQGSSTSFNGIIDIQPITTPISSF